MSDSPIPTVHLVGAGPGDPGLITVRGRQLLDQADVIVHDALVSAELMATLPGSAELVNVGKRRGKKLAEQEQIHDILARHARAGRRVVRLKGGDPFLFGRGGEEMIALHALGVPCEVVPGITSGFAAPAAAGIPVTHRRVSGGVTIITGHDATDAPDRGASWHHLACTDHTLVILMGLARIGEICDRLEREGRPADTPVAVIQEGTTPRQREVRGTLSDIAARVSEAGIVAPATIVVGPVSAIDGLPRPPR